MIGQCTINRNSICQSSENLINIDWQATKIRRKRNENVCACGKSSSRTRMNGGTTVAINVTGGPRTSSTSTPVNATAETPEDGRIGLRSGKGDLYGVRGWQINAAGFPPSCSCALPTSDSSAISFHIWKPSRSELRSHGCEVEILLRHPPLRAAALWWPPSPWARPRCYGSPPPQLSIVDPSTICYLTNCHEVESWHPHASLFSGSWESNHRKLFIIMMKLNDMDGGRSETQKRKISISISIKTQLFVSYRHASCRSELRARGMCTAVCSRFIEYFINVPFRNKKLKILFDLQV